MSLVSNRRNTSPSTNGSADDRQVSFPGSIDLGPSVDIDLRPVDEGLVVAASPMATSSLYIRGGKRGLDIALSAILLVVLAPVCVSIACLVRFRLGTGGVIFRQHRIGLDGCEFTMYKFRSMLPDRRVEDLTFDGPDRRSSHKNDNDPRHRPLGRFLRSASLDELPQLWNVIIGDMSLVGPRPEVKEIVLRRCLLNHPRHKVRPGITGPFQVSDLRFEGRLELGFEMDTSYATNIRLSSDCRYLLRTLAAPFTRRGR